MPNFIVFWWRKKKKVSFAGKRAESAKKWIINELDKPDDEEDTGVRDRIGKMGTEDADGNDLKTVPLTVELASDVNDIEMTDCRKPRPSRNPRHSPPEVGLKHKEDPTANDKSLLTLIR